MPFWQIVPLSVATVYESRLPHSRDSSMPVVKLCLNGPVRNSPNSSVRFARLLIELLRLLLRRQTLPFTTLPWLSSGCVQM